MNNGRIMANARVNKKDEFYTKFDTIEDEVSNYKKHFEGKTVYLNCDDPRESQFFHYFVQEFNNLKLKRLIASCYVSQDYNLFNLSEEREKAVYVDYDGIGSPQIQELEGDGVVPGEKYDKDNYYRCSNLTPEVGYDFKENLNDMIVLFDKMRNKSFMSAEKYGLVFALPISIKLGTRSYSFYLTDNRNQRDHFGQQNNDIITSLEMSKYGFVNAIVEGIPQYNSVDTQVLAGGATDVYKKFGTLDKAKILVQAQPNYSKVSVVYSRVHHFVDFNQYNKQRLLGAVKPNQDK